MEDFIIRRYKDGDEIEINELFNEIFQKSRSMDEWAWKFKKGPLHDVNLTVVAEFCENGEVHPDGTKATLSDERSEYGGRLIGQYTALPFLFKFQDKLLRFAEPVDIFTHPDFRGGIKGVLRMAYDYHYEVCLKEKISVEFGLPTKPHYIFGKRILKYLDLGQVHVLFKRLNYKMPVKNRLPWLPDILIKVVKNASSIGFSQKIRRKYRDMTKGKKICKVTSFDERFDSFWDRVKDQYKIINVRNQLYLDWRYSKPGSEYEILIAEKGDELLGYVVTAMKKTDEDTVVGYIVDILAVEDAGFVLISNALLNFVSKNVDYALCWMLPGSRVYDILQGFGFSERDSFNSIDIVYRIYDPENIDDAVLKDLKNWYLTMGDADAI